MTSEPKLCRNCKFAEPEPNSEWSLRCLNPKVNSEDNWALSSRHKSRGTSCSVERSKRSWFSVCGMKGKQWVVNDKEW